jgi:hypothetical protein
MNRFKGEQSPQLLAQWRRRIWLSRMFFEWRATLALVLICMVALCTLLAAFAPHMGLPRWMQWGFGTLVGVFIAVIVLLGLFRNKVAGYCAVDAVDFSVPTAPGADVLCNDGGGDFSGGDGGEGGD